MNKRKRKQSEEKRGVEGTGCKLDSSVIRLKHLKDDCLNKYIYLLHVRRFPRTEVMIRYELRFVMERHCFVIFAFVQMFPEMIPE